MSPNFVRFLCSDAVYPWVKFPSEVIEFNETVIDIVGTGDGVAKGLESTAACGSCVVGIMSKLLISHMNIAIRSCRRRAVEPPGHRRPPPEGIHHA